MTLNPFFWILVSWHLLSEIGTWTTQDSQWEQGLLRGPSIGEEQGKPFLPGWVLAPQVCLVPPIPTGTKICSAHGGEDPS